MPRENAHDKGRRLLVEGRLTVKAVSEHHVCATVRGDSATVYTLTASDRGFTCSCPAVGRCSHQVALMLVALRPQVMSGPGPEGIR